MRQPPQTHQGDQHQASDTNHLCSPSYTFGTTFSYCLQLCIYITSSYILPPNVCKCYKDYFDSRPIHSYPSTSSLLHYYTKVGQSDIPPITSSGRSTGLTICTYRFLGKPIAMHYVRTLCDKYFLTYDGFS